MQVLIAANEQQTLEIKDKNTRSESNLVFVKRISDVKNYELFDAIFLLTNDISSGTSKEFPGKPVFINSVIDTLAQLNLPYNYSRVNGWPGFLQRPVWEVATNDDKAAKIIFEELGWDVLFVKDEPGLIAPRVISMIVNEAYFALAEEVSTKDEIDLAMKLGTNYPFGPFEWQNKIGIKNIYELLKKLSETDRRYLVSPELERNFKESSKIY